jgi:predicted Rossmann fold nucleotide-binding protein DprA/Smf involved in DNA uptake
MRKDFGLRSESAQSIVERGERLRQEAATLLDRARELRITILAPADTSYPVQIDAFYDGEPPLLYARGNLDLLTTRSFALLNSAAASPEALDHTFAFAHRLAEAGATVLASPEGAAFNLVGTAAKQANGRLIVVVHRGLFDFLNGHPERDPLPLARRISGEMDPDRVLLISPFRLDGRWQRGNGRRRDTLLAALAETLIAVQVRAGGTMESLCRKALRLGRRVFACPSLCGSSEAPYGALVQAGEMPLVADAAATNIDLVLQTNPALPAPFVASDDLERRRALGQFFTPPEVAAFMWDLATLLRGRKLARTARVIDPACGEGVFLRVARERGGLPSSHVFGVDVDEFLWAVWQGDPILRDARLFRANGLLDNPSIGLLSSSFDLVIGNPPFSGKGLKDLLRLLPGREGDEVASPGLFTEDSPASGIAAETCLPRHERTILDYVARQLGRYVCWRLQQDSEELNGDELQEENASGSLFAGHELPDRRPLQATDYDRMAALIADWPAHRPLDLDSRDMRQMIRRMASTAIEAFFTERFVQLARPGGMIAVILPESILASDQLSRLRSWFLEQTQLMAVISLPQKVFTGVGANAKTGILFARRLTAAERKATEKMEPDAEGYRLLAALRKDWVLMASPDLESPQWTSLDDYLKVVLERARWSKRQ